MNPIRGFKELFSAARIAGAEAEIPAHQTEARKAASKDVVIISITVMFSLILIRYAGDDYCLYALGRMLGFDHLLPSTLANTPASELVRLGWWIFIVVVGYLLIPLAVLKWVMKKNIMDHGMRMRGIWKDGWIYFFMLLIMIPLVFLVGKGEGFQAKYPYYQVPGEGLSAHFWIWEGMYFFQFFTLEFFFRGFMLHGSKARFGYYAIFFMCVPYCMIHFSKPLGETLGSILAGIALGALSLKSRSIWLGTLLHYSVAILMDIVAMYYKGLL